MLNREACKLASQTCAVVQTATRLAAHQLGDELNERTASTTTEARTPRRTQECAARRPLPCCRPSLR